MKKTVSVLLILALILSSIAFSVTAESEDPAENYTHTDAPYEDAGLSLWFDHPTEKIKDTTVNDTGLEAYSVYMAQNEIEDAQFVLYAEDGREGMSAEMTAPTDGENTLDADIYIELYANCDNFGYVPDAIPPLSAYGDFDLTAGKTQAFLIKVKTTAETTPGWYESTVTVKNSDGEAVKLAKLYVFVWDFALSEETACGTSINLDYGILGRSIINSDLTTNELYVRYYDYLLENRVNAYKLPYNLYSADAIEYMDNPRVTSFQMGSFTGADAFGMSDIQIKRIYTAFEDHPERYNKMYMFSNVVDAATPGDLERLRTAYDTLVDKYGKYAPSYAEDPIPMINTYINDIDYTTADGVIDQIEYYRDFVNFWCSKPFAYTDMTELTTPGAKVMQPLKWDSVYGTFKDRMADIRSSGQRVWWFLSWDVAAPYINYFMQTDGVAQRILFWQQFDNDVQGFLYNFVNYWTAGQDNAYVTNSSYPDGHGESILIYPGSDYGMDDPVGSLRLEAMRDGIEDYQLFHMLEEMKGTGTADSFIDVMTTGMVHYSTSDEDYRDTRIALGNAVANAVNGREDEPGEPDEPDFTVGDIDGDGKINAKDINLEKQIVLGTVDKVPAADIDGDGKVTVTDVASLKLLVLG